MSNVIYGYIYADNFISNDKIFATLNAASPLGISRRPLEKLYNWPPEFLPRESAIGFTIHDSKNSNSSEYILDYVDYGQESNIRLPVSKDDRLTIFCMLLRDLIHYTHCSEIQIAVTDSCEIDRICRVNMSDFQDKLRAHLAEFGTSNTLYMITSDQ